VESPMAIPQRRDARHLCQSAMERWEKKDGEPTDVVSEKLFLRVFTYHICLTCIYIYVCIMYIYMYVYIFLLSIYWFIYL
jgi:hypothetical protein